VHPGRQVLGDGGRLLVLAADVDRDDQRISWRGLGEWPHRVQPQPARRAAARLELVTTGRVSASEVPASGRPAASVTV
jgi:hypothetical protein